MAARFLWVVNHVNCRNCDALDVKQYPTVYLANDRIIVPHLRIYDNPRIQWPEWQTDDDENDNVHAIAHTT